MSLVEEQPKEMRMVTPPPGPPREVVLDPPRTEPVTAAPGVTGPELPRGDGFVVEWQLAGGASLR